MSATAHVSLPSFTCADYAAPAGPGDVRRGRGRADRASSYAGPDLVWLTGYRPTAITERLTLLVLRPDREPTLLVPVLERPDAEAAVGAPGLSIVDWADGADPYAVAAALLRPDGTVRRSPTRPGRCTCSACSRRCPGPRTGR